jgi:hypothetical protein
MFWLELKWDLLPQMKTFLGLESEEMSLSSKMETKPIQAPQVMLGSGTAGQDSNEEKKLKALDL